MDLIDIMNTAPYPYAPGQTKGGDTSEAAQEKAARNTQNNKMREDALGYFAAGNKYSAEGIARALRARWRTRYESEGDYLQDCRRRCSELVKLGKVVDSGERELSERNQNTIRMWVIKKV